MRVVRYLARALSGAAASPKAAVAALAAAVDKGDAKAAAALLVADEAHATWAQSTVALAGALKTLDAAAVARFGPAVGDTVSQHRLHLTDAFKAAEQAQEKVDGDAATVTSPGQTSPLTLTKAPDGRWLLRVAPAAEPAQRRQRELYARLIAAAVKTAAEVAAKTYDTPEAAAAAFASRVTEARLGT